MTSDNRSNKTAVTKKRKSMRGKKDLLSLSEGSSIRSSSGRDGETVEPENLFADLEKALDAASTQLLNAESTIGANPSTASKNVNITVCVPCWCGLPIAPNLLLFSDRIFNK